MFDKYAKAIVGAIIAALGSLQTAMLDGTIQPVETVGVAIAFVSTLGVVWGVGEFNQKVELQKAQLAAMTPTTTVVASTPTVTVSTGAGGATMTAHTPQHAGPEESMPDGMR